MDWILSLAAWDLIPEPIGGCQCGRARRSLLRTRGWLRGALGRREVDALPLERGDQLVREQAHQLVAVEVAPVQPFEDRALGEALPPPQGDPQRRGRIVD